MRKIDPFWKHGPSADTTKKGTKASTVKNSATSTTTKELDEKENK